MAKKNEPSPSPFFNFALFLHPVTQMTGLTAIVSSLGTNDRLRRAACGNAARVQGARQALAGKLVTVALHPGQALAGSLPNGKPAHTAVDRVHLMT
jgi:hypothetical protein